MPRNRFLLTLPLLACTLVACGRRGPLELPPGSPPPPRAQVGVADPQGQANRTRPSLARDTLDDDALSRQQVLAPPTPIVVPKTPFFLDPLL